MTLKTLPFDVARHLDTIQSQREMLSDAALTGDANYMRHALQTVARARGLSGIAAETGISRASLFEALLAEDGSSIDVLISLYRSLGAEMPPSTTSAAAE